MAQAGRVGATRLVAVFLVAGMTAAATACVRPAPPSSGGAAPADTGFDATALAAGPATLRLPVAGLGAATREHVERRGPADVTWYGHLDTDPGGAVVATSVDGAVAATVETPAGTVALSSNGPGRPLRAQPVGRLTAATERVVRAPAAAVPARRVPMTVAALDAPAPTHAVIDVLIVYGARAVTVLGDLGAKAEAQHAVDRANIAFYASHIGVQLRLVGAVNLTRYESDLASLDTVQASVPVAALRNATGADLVQAWNEGTGGCGAGYQNTGALPPAYGISLVAADCVTSVAPIHEWGHNLGAGHDHATDDPAHAGERAYPDSYGYVSEAGGFVTIMAYDGPSCPPAGCQRVYYFSNPAVTWRGLPTGVTGYADNARAINALGPVVAAYGAVPG